MTVEDLEVQVWNEQSGVYAVREFEPGEHVMKVSGEVGSAPTRYSIQVSAKRHIHPEGPDAPWRFLNHSCRPNLALDPESRQFVALELIPAGEQLTFNYLTTEWEMAEAFNCACGHEECFGVIAGFKNLDDPAKERLLEDVLPHIRKLHEGVRVDSQQGTANLR